MSYRKQKYSLGMRCGHTLRVGHARWDSLSEGDIHMCGQCGLPRTIDKKIRYQTRPREQNE